MAACLCAVGFGLGVQSAHAVTINWVTVGDPGNTADTAPAGYGDVADSFRIMRYERTSPPPTPWPSPVWPAAATCDSAAASKPDTTKPT